jgi:hypothetical protein
MTTTHTPETMRERMARALYEAWALRERVRKPGAEIPSWGGVLNYGGGDGATAEARRWILSICYAEVDAILDVLAEPSEGMREAGARAHDFPSSFVPGPTFDARVAAPRVWRAMVAAVRSGAA